MESDCDPDTDTDPDDAVQAALSGSWLKPSALPEDNQSQREGPLTQ